jgi:HrpA-like RNA helicase
MIDNHLVRSLIRKIVMQQQAEGHLNTRSDRSNKKGAGFRETGAILVFLPGRAEIDSLARCLHGDMPLLGNREICSVLKLHSAIPHSQQRSAFQPARKGTVKIILSTNLAESSVTISDVNHCIDTCLVKESRFNSQTRIKELVTVYTSKASGIQRAGRAGRTSPGTCWRLVRQDFWESQLLEQTAPEMIRAPLDELILHVSLLYERRRDELMAEADEGKVANFPPGLRPIKFLSKTPTPPPEASLVEACRHLVEVDALRVVDCNDIAGTEASWLYRLTPLGYHLSRLPMDAKVGKVLIVGCILGCLDGALTVAASLSCTKSCFLSSMGNSQKSWDDVIQARAKLVEDGFGGQEWKGGTVKGDLIAVIAAYRSWKQQKSEQTCLHFCKLHGLDHWTLKDLDQLRKQFMESLIDAGFVPRSNTDDTSFDTVECNEASEDALLTSCCLVAGLYPNVCTLMRPRKGGPKGGRLLTKDGDICMVSSNSLQKTRLERAAETGKDAYGVFHAKQRNTGTTIGASAHRSPQVFLMEMNFVSRFALLLFGGELDICNNATIVDEWLKFKVSRRDSDSPNEEVENAVLIYFLREALDDIVREYILKTSSNAEEKAAMIEHRKAVIEVVRRLLSEEG